MLTKHILSNDMQLTLNENHVTTVMRNVYSDQSMCSQHVHVPCNHCIRTECILVDVCFVMTCVMQESQGEQCCALMGYSWVNMT